MVDREKRWVRHGECQPDECGAACCREVGIWEYIGGPADTHFGADYLAARCLEVLPIDENWRQVVIPHRCPRLTFTNRCEIHELKPALCREFPAHPTQLEGLEGCTYWFTEEEVSLDE